MSVWSIVLSAGGDITELVDVTSIKKIRRIHSELKPNVNRVEFRAQFTAALWAALLSTEDIIATITKDGVTYFYGYVSPNFETAIADGRKFVSMIVEDPTLKQLGRTITTTFYALGAKVCDPADTAHSLVHLIAAAAGATLAAGLPTISTVIPYVVVLPKDKTTWASLLTAILFCYSYVYMYSDAGILTIIEAINSSTIATTGTLSIVAGGGNLRRSLNSRKVAHKYDDIRVSYDTVELKTGITLFKDTAGASGSKDCVITLKAAGDADGADYYPKGSRDGEVYAEWNNPDGLEIVAATSAALDTIIGGGITQSLAFTNYYRRASFAYHNTSGYAQIITRMRIVGDAYVKTASNIARSDTTGGELLLEYAAKYIFDTAAAQALARRLGQYYAHSCQTYNARSKTSFDVGAYVLASDSVYSGRSQKCRIVGKTFLECERLFEYDLEAVDDYTPIDIVIDSTAVHIQSEQSSSAVNVAAETAANIYNYSNNVPPTNNITNLAIESETNADGSIDIKLSWDYTQGAVAADGFLVFFKSSAAAPGTLDIYTDPNVFITAGDATSYSKTLPALSALYGGAGTVPRHYRFGVVAVGIRLSGTIPHASGVVELAGWTDKVFQPSIGDMDIDVFEGAITSRTGFGAYRRGVRHSESGIEFIDSPVGGTDIVKASIYRQPKGTGSVVLQGDMKAEVTLPYTAVEHQISPVSRAWGLSAWSPDVGIFCIVSLSAGSICATSPDGITWTEHTISSTSRFWAAVAWSPKLSIFCAITSQDKYSAISYDGITWSESQISTTSRFWKDIVWSDKLDVFCALAYNSTICATSPDGITWTEHTISSTSRYWYSIKWSNKLSLFLVVANTSTICATSPDGITWTEHTISSTSRSWNQIAWSDELGIFCITSSASTICATSPDGITWTEHTISSTSRSWATVEWANGPGVFLTAANTSTICATSPDGITWTEHTISSTSRSWYDIVWSNELYSFLLVETGTYSALITTMELDKVGTGIIERGSNTYGSYIKFGDGTLDAYIVKSFTSAGTAASQGGAWTGWSWTYSPPVSFYSIDELTINNPITTGGYLRVGQVTGTQIFVFNDFSDTWRNCTVYVHIHGRWKA